MRDEARAASSWMVTAPALTLAAGPSRRLSVATCGMETEKRSVGEWSLQSCLETAVESTTANGSVHGALGAAGKLTSFERLSGQNLASLDTGLSQWIHLIERASKDGGVHE